MNIVHPRIKMTMSNYPKGQNSRVKMDPFFKLNGFKSMIIHLLT